MINMFKELLSINEDVDVTALDVKSDLSDKTNCDTSNVDHMIPDLSRFYEDINKIGRELAVNIQEEAAKYNPIGFKSYGQRTIHKCTAECTKVEWNKETSVEQFITSLRGQGAGTAYNMIDNYLNNQPLVSSNLNDGDEIIDSLKNAAVGSTVTVEVNSNMIRNVLNYVPQSINEGLKIAFEVLTDYNLLVGAIKIIKDRDHQCDNNTQKCPICLNWAALYSKLAKYYNMKFRVMKTMISVLSLMGMEAIQIISKPAKAINEATSKEEFNEEDAAEYVNQLYKMIEEIRSYYENHDYKDIITPRKKHVDKMEEYMLGALNRKYKLKIPIYKVENATDEVKDVVENKFIKGIENIVNDYPNYIVLSPDFDKEDKIDDEDMFIYITLKEPFGKGIPDEDSRVAQSELKDHDDVDLSDSINDVTEKIKGDSYDENDKEKKKDKEEDDDDDSKNESVIVFDEFGNLI